MTTNALLFGSIGVLVETSDMQRRAFNAAFADAGLGWEWDKDTYTGLLKKSGGEDRIARYATQRHQTVDAEALHQAKVDHYARMMADTGLSLRPGIRDLMDEAANRAIPIGWVTDTGTEQLDAIFDNLGSTLSRDEFAFVGAGMHVDNRKPAPDIYEAALSDLQVAQGSALAVEDTGICALAAVAAGIRTVGYPNAYADLGDFPDEVRIVTELTPDLLDD
jgi:beta-phosphoglucomutase-like phosphatase (HAD superfamily)